MKARRVVVGLAAVGAMFAIGQVPAAANVVWCFDDPPVQAVTPTGSQLMVSNQVTLPASSRHDKNSVWGTTTTQPDGHGGTLITDTIHGPAGVTLIVTATVNRYNVTATGSGVGVVTLYLDVPTT
jgi:hypothetical protein